MCEHLHGYNGGQVPILTIKLAIKLDEIKKQHLVLSMRELTIEKYNEILDNMNKYWKGWGDKNYMIKPYPDFDKISDKELFESFLKEYENASVLRG